MFTETVYAWQSRGEPTKFVLCTDRDRREFKAFDWDFKGDWSTIQELVGLGSDIVKNGTAHGGSLCVTVDPPGSFYHRPYPNS